MRGNRGLRQYSGMSLGDMRRFLDKILQVIDEFEQGAMDVERLQSALDACAASLDNSRKEMLDELRAVDADLETIRFSTPTQEQHAAARVRVRQLKHVISRVEPSE
jgi:hypothetical protein